MSENITVESVSLVLPDDTEGDVTVHLQQASEGPTDDPTADIARRTLSSKFVNTDGEPTVFRLPEHVAPSGDLCLRVEVDGEPSPGARIATALSDHDARITALEGVSDDGE